MNLGRRRAPEVRDTEPNSRDLLETRDPIDNDYGTYGMHVVESSSGFCRDPSFRGFAASKVQSSSRRTRPFRSRGVRSLPDGSS